MATQSEPLPRDNNSVRASKIAAAALFVAGVAVAVQVTANLVDFGVFDYRFQLVDPNSETSLFAWVSGLFLAAAAAITLWRAWTSRIRRGAYLVTGVLLAVLALENRLRIDEARVHQAVIYVPLLGAVFGSLLWVSNDFVPPARRTVWLGLAALCFSLALHKIAPPVLAHFGWGSGDWPYEIKVSLKESGEICGWILLAAGLLAAAPLRSSPGFPLRSSRRSPVREPSGSMPSEPLG